MFVLLTASSEVEINQLFDNHIEKADAEWAAFYRQKWIIASLNKHISKIDNETWVTSSNNTNTAKAAHILSNCRGKNLKIVIAILQGCKLDKERFTSIHAKKTINYSDEEDKCNDNGNDKENNVTKSLSKSDELEYQERALALKDDLREREAKVHIIELTNIEKERELNLNKNKIF
ncbi:unnamed protein product [Rhizophagus irregularis]|nr:unnamed protein product [Rhizophagus irregularis]